jgi:threonine/homoserine/homoserine lactone efflux protein
MLNIIQNILLGISLAAPIGPVNIEVIKRGLKYGFWPAFLLSLGAATADSTYLIVIYFGFYNLLDIPIVKTIIWFFGTIVLLYLGYLNIKEHFDKFEFQNADLKGSKNAFIAGYLITISNPMTIVWWLGIFGAVMGSSIQNASKTVALLNSMTIIIGVVLWFFTLSLLLHWGKRFVNEKMMKYISTVAGVVLIGFGLYFGYNAVLRIF